MNYAAKTLPIKLEGAGNLMYNNIAEFMGNKEKCCGYEQIASHKFCEICGSRCVDTK